MEYRSFNQSNANSTSNQSNHPFDGIGNLESQELDAFKIIFETIVAFLGVVGNIAVCAVVTRNKKKRSSTEYLLRNLAVADLGVLFVIFPLAIIKEKMPFNWPLGKFTCLYLYPITETFYGVSVWTIVGVAVERYRHLFNPIKRGRRKAIKNAKRISAAIWIGSFLVFSAPVFFWVEYLETSRFQNCHLKFKDPKVMEAYIVILLLLWYVVPVALIIWTYVAISKQLHKSNIFLKTMNQNESSSPEVLGTRGRNTPYSGTQVRRLQQNRKVKRILTPVVAAFTITMLPVNLFRVIILYCPSLPDSPLYPILIYLVALCVVINSSINPLIYCLVSRGFRVGMMALVKCRPPKGLSILGSGVRSFKERINLKIRRSKLFSFEEEANTETKQAEKGGSTPKKCESGSQQTLPD